MSRIEQMRARLATLEPLALDIRDDSHKHAGHAGARDGAGHYALHIVSERFGGLNTMARHRMVYCALGDMMQGKIHALTIDARTPQETR